MKNKENEKYVKLGLTGIAVIVISFLCFFFLYRFEIFSGTIKGIFRILRSFLYGAVIAYLLAPLCNRLERLLGKIIKGRKRDKIIPPLAIAISLLLALIVLWALLMMVIPQVCKSIIDMIQALPGQMENAILWAGTQLENQPEWQTQLNELYIELETRLQDWMQTDLLPTVQTLLNSLGGRIAELVTLLKDLFLGIMVSIYILGSRKKFAAQATMLLYGIFPKTWAGQIHGEVCYADRMFSGFLMGKLLDSAIIGVICFIVTSLMGIQSALLVSTIVGVTNIIPFFGPFIGAIPCILLLLLENPFHCLCFIIFVIILQQIDGNIIGPKILGNATGLSGFWVLFSILLFGGLWGFVGMVIAVPLFAVLYDIIRRLIFKGLSRHGSEELIQEYGRRFGEAAAVQQEKPERKKGQVKNKK